MRQRLRRILRFLWINTLAALVVPFIVWVLSPHTTFGSLLVTFAFSCLHAQIIGGLATYTLPKIGRLLGRLHPLLEWVLYILSCLVIALAGGMLAGVVILVLHLIPPPVYWSEFA